MFRIYWFAAIAGAVFVGWAHDHTDELPIVLGFVLLLGVALGALEPRRFAVSWAIAGAPMAIVEALVRYGRMRAPWPRSEAQPLAALVAYLPAAIGVAVGVGLRLVLQSARAAGRGATQ